MINWRALIGQLRLETFTIANLADPLACTIFYFANFVTEPSVSPSAVQKINIEAESVNTEAVKKEKEYVHNIALDLKLNIQILLRFLRICQSNSYVNLVTYQEEILSDF